MDNDAGRLSDDVTRLLREYSNGLIQSLDEVVAIVYRELHSLARQQLRRSNIGQQVHTTVLVHEAYEKLAAGKIQQVTDRRHFFAIASRAMRQIVIDTYRAENAEKRGGGVLVLTLSVNSVIDGNNPESVVAIDQALQTLAEHDSELAEIVDLSCFGGLTNQDIAELTGTTLRTVQRKLKRARAWLAHFMNES